MNASYIYNPSRTINHSYLSLWHRSKLIRDIQYSFYHFKFRLVARFIIRHKLWWNSDDEKRWQEYV